MATKVTSTCIWLMSADVETDDFHSRPWSLMCWWEKDGDVGQWPPRGPALFSLPSSYVLFASISQMMNIEVWPSSNWQQAQKLKVSSSDCCISYSCGTRYAVSVCFWDKSEKSFSKIKKRKRRVSTWKAMAFLRSPRVSFVILQPHLSAGADSSLISFKHHQ